VTAGESYDVSVSYQTDVSSIVMIQLFDSSWNKLVGEWTSVTSDSTSELLSLVVPASASSGSSYHWQAVLMNDSWSKIAEDVVWSVSITAPSDRISLNAATTLVAGNTYTVSTDFVISQDGITQAKLFDSSWSSIVSDWTTVSAGVDTEIFSLTIPSSTPAGTDYIWQAVLADSAWAPLDSEVQYNITVQASQSSGEWLPAGNWELDWSDEFTGSGSIDNWYPMLGWGPNEFFPTGNEYSSEKPLRTTDGAETASMYSTASGNHWLNGQGQMVIRAIVDKTDSNLNGYKVKTAYLQTGYPATWDSSEPSGVKWEGKFVSPKDGALYISARVRTDQLQGYGTWFAFWLHTQTRAYNSTPSDGTEVDVVEIVKSDDVWAQQSFNVANHWNQDGGSESQMFENTRTDPDLNSLSYVNVEDSNYHIYGIEWTETYMKCSVDGQVYYTFTENIPSDPVDMMILLTMEFEKDGWWGSLGDGRSEGPYVSDDTTMREMSRVLIDYVRVYKKQ
jgi:hypothetical protein